MPTPNNNKEKKENHEEKITRVIIDVMNQKFEEHEKKQQEMYKNHEMIVINLISDNNKIINGRLDSLSKEMEDIIASIEFSDTTIAEQNTTIKTLQKTCKKIISNEEEIKNAEVTILSLQEKIIDLENRSRRNNLRIDGIKENANESWEDTEAKVKKVFTDTLGIINNIKIERAHRTGPVKEERARTIVLRLLDFKDKSIIFKNAKNLAGTGIYINQDYAKETAQKRKKLIDEAKELKQEGKYAVIQYPFTKIYWKERRAANSE